MPPAEVEARQRTLHALEQAVGVRRAILASAESSFDTIQQLQASDDGARVGAGGASQGHGTRTLLRERDDLALEILRVQAELATVQEEGQRLAREIRDVRQHTIASLHEARDQTPTQAKDTTQRQSDLLHGVVLGLALHGEHPWYEDPQLTELVLSMDDRAASNV
ncbi:uncharacterized protein MJAP1_004327 [Malassezia japonica]|uniref:Centromere protein H C-terminal domain-containing protein n=1 Tax=Malassezia japonica TaxID=223818 RepID=A0AAF0F5R8_9BASI|nr:uncharacterized protein MJAP1_004327 [Malassezia japonica]WFD41330.1 hypothetical protein MJAP1_004327 [Malassezia japonica]